MSEVYNERMIDTDATHIWCWDVRPFPDFPARETVWADGGNWEKGHWLTGRVGLVTAADVVHDLVSRTGLVGHDTSKITGLIDGYMIDRPMSARAALGPLTLIYGFDVVEGASGLDFVPQNGASVTDLAFSDIAQGDITRTQADPEGLLRDVRISFVDNAHDYQTGAVSARNRDAETVRIFDLSVPIVMDASFARYNAQRLLSRATDLGATLDFTLSPARIDITAGDVVTVAGIDGLWQVDSLDGPGAPRISARAYDGDDLRAPNAGAMPVVTSDPIWVPKPTAAMIDIANYDVTPRTGPLVGAYAAPFNSAAISHLGGNASVTVDDPIKVGALLTDMPRGPVGLWDRAAVISAYLPAVQISAISSGAALSGGNRFAVETQNGWEIIIARDVVLTGENRYQLSYLLRGLSGTDADMMEVVPSGARIIWLGQGLVNMPVDNAFIGADIDVRAVMAGRESDVLAVDYAAAHLRPLRPVHAHLKDTEAGLSLSWIRRTRSGGDSWTGLDVPLGEAEELYQITVVPMSGEPQTFEVTTPHFMVPEFARADIDHITIAQGSQAYGFGPPLLMQVE